MATIQLDPARWSYQDLNDFILAIGRAKYDNALMLAAKIIVEWTYVDKSGAPIEVNDYGRLPYPQLQAILKTVNQRINKYIEDLDISEVKVDLDAWLIDDFLDWQAANAKGDIARMEKLMRQVVKLDGVTDERLTLTQGSIMARAIRKANKEVMGQGN